MQRIAYVLMLATIVIMIGYAMHIKEERLQIESLLWVEFDAALEGLVRMLYIAEATPNASRPALLAAYEHGLILRRLAPVTERLLSWHGVQAEPLAGYITSLTGGVASICEDARQHGTADTFWIAEVRDRLESLHALLNAEAMRRPNRKALQHTMDQLFGSHTVMFFSVPVDANITCKLI